MKEGIHPKYEQTTIRCACGEIIETGSTKKDIKVEICSKCHPFYTGKQKLVDTKSLHRIGADFFHTFFGQIRRICRRPHRAALREEPGQNFGGSYAAE